jgi:hypothetical protein
LNRSTFLHWLRYHRIPFSRESPHEQARRPCQLS